MVDSTFVQIAPVALPMAQGTVRGTVITAVYALDSLGTVWKLMDHSGQKWMRVTAEREGEHDRKMPLFNGSGNGTA
jgi:Tfp pilus tip-associated adhesin PilY1